MSGSAIVIAHRGASGYLPEHTLAAKALAFGLGADFLEQDVVATRDSELVVLHDLHLDDVTDVAEHFPGRQRGDGRHYVIDFDLAELQSLRVFERRQPGARVPRYPQRYPPEWGTFRITTLDEELQLVQGLSKTMGRRVGIYPEIKDPRWHADNGLDLTKLLLAKLAAFGYSGVDDPAYVQCFDGDELRRARHDLRCGLKLVQLVSTEPSHAELLSPQGLRAVATYAHGLGPSYTQLVQEHAGGCTIGPLTQWARDAGLQLHPYTFRRDELPSYASTLEELLETFFVDLGVDGVFCDHPDVAVRTRDTVFATSTNRRHRP